MKRRHFIATAVGAVVAPKLPAAERLYLLDEVPQWNPVINPEWEAAEYEEWVSWLPNVGRSIHGFLRFRDPDAVACFEAFRASPFGAQEGWALTGRRFKRLDDIRVEVPKFLPL